MKIGPAEAAGSKTGVRVRRGSACALVLSAFDLVLCPGECLRPLSSVICRPFQPVSFCSQPSSPKPPTTPSPRSLNPQLPNPQPPPVPQPVVFWPPFKVQSWMLDVGCWMFKVRCSRFKVQGSRFDVGCCVPASLRPCVPFQPFSMSAFQLFSI
jgi:hypothetical protein